MFCVYNILFCLMLSCFHWAPIADHIYLLCGVRVLSPFLCVSRFPIKQLCVYKCVARAVLSYMHCICCFVVVFGVERAPLIHPSILPFYHPFSTSLSRSEPPSNQSMIHYKHTRFPKKQDVICWRTHAPYTLGSSWFSFFIILLCFSLDSWLTYILSHDFVVFIFLFALLCSPNPRY